MPLHILVAEDQSDIRHLLVMNLRSAGYEVAAVADGPSVLSSQAERPSDLLILDLMMPALNETERARLGLTIPARRHPAAARNVTYCSRLRKLQACAQPSLPADFSASNAAFHHSKIQ